jgi:hypothetical protein
MTEELTEHLPACELASIELCTCGLGARQRELERMRVDPKVAEIIRERQAAYDRSVRRNRIKRMVVKIAFMVGLLVLSTGYWWASFILFAVWMAGGTVMWFIEGLPGGDAQPGLVGWLRFLFW